MSLTDYSGWLFTLKWREKLQSAFSGELFLESHQRVQHKACDIIFPTCTEMGKGGRLKKRGGVVPAGEKRRGARRAKWREKRKDGRERK